MELWMVPFKSTGFKSIFVFNYELIAGIDMTLAVISLLRRD